jgi:exosome complex component RRP46
MVTRAAAFNAASLAAMHAGSVGMKAVPLAVGVALVDGEFVLDPSAEEEAAADARFGFGWAFGAGVSSAKDRMDEEAEEAESVWIEAEGAFTRQQVSSSALVKLTAVQRGA